MEEPFLRPAFPDWMKRVEPLLEAENTNSLFEAFRLRREVHAGGGLSGVVRVLRLKNVLSMLGLAVVVVFFVVLAFLVIGLCAIPFIVALVTLGARILQRRRIVSAALPRKLGHIFSKRGLMIDQAIDLWLTGATGRDVLEALYLEKREGQQITLIVMVVAFALLPAGCYIAAVDLHEVGVILVGMLLVASHQLFWLLYIGQLNTIRKSILEARVQSWSYDSHLRQSLGEAWGQFLIACGMLFVLLISLLCLFDLADTPGMPIEFTTCFVLLIFSVLVQLNRKSSLMKVQDAIRATIAQGDYAFDRFMASVVMEDSEGADWAKWLHFPPKKGRDLNEIELDQLQFRERHSQYPPPEMPKQEVLPQSRPRTDWP